MRFPTRQPHAYMHSLKPEEIETKRGRKTFQEMTLILFHISPVYGRCLLEASCCCHQGFFRASRAGGPFQRNPQNGQMTLCQNKSRENVGQGSGTKFKVEAIDLRRRKFKFG